MKIAIPIFDKVTALDAIGPYEVLSRVPAADLRFTSFDTGLVRTDNRMLALHADATFDEFDDPDVLVFPGGFGTRTLMRDQGLLDWVRRVHEHTEWTTSVCTGSLVLGAAGLLDGLEATTHWSVMDVLAETGARPTDRRVVPQGKIVTAAGVSSGIDMALWLAGQIAGDTVAQAIQLGIEYDPQPPYDAGSPSKAPADVLELVRGLEAAQADEPARAQTGAE